MGYSNEYNGTWEMNLDYGEVTDRLIDEERLEKREKEERYKKEKRELVEEWR